MLSEIAFPEGNIPKYGTAMMQPEYCGKWRVRFSQLVCHFSVEPHFQALEDLLKEWRKDKTNKVLIFTKSVKLLDMLDFHLNTKCELPIDFFRDQINYTCIFSIPLPQTGW